MRSFKTVQKHQVYQIVCKVPKASQGSFLEASGQSELLLRDFVPRGASLIDIKAAPRFFEVSKQGLDQAVKSSIKVKGFCGLAVTRRGLAVRSWISELGHIGKLFWLGALVSVSSTCVSLREVSIT